MATPFPSFTSSASPLTTEFAVGYATNVSGGERRWLWSDVRTLMQANLGALATVTPGTGVATALAVNVGSAGAFVVFGGALGTPSSGTLTSCTGLPVSTGISGLGTGIATALAVNVGSAGAFVTFDGALGTPSSGTVTNLTGTASININGTVGATTPTTGAFTTVATSSTVTSTFTGQTADAYFNGLSLINSTAAAASDQQYSPSLILTGQGWKTNATAASQQVDWRITNVPVQGSSEPSSTLIYASQINGAGYVDRFSFGSSGSLNCSDIVLSGGLSATSVIRFSASTILTAPSNGVLTLNNSTLSSFTRLNFGGTTSSFVALQTSGTTLTVGTADGGTSAGALTVSGALTANGGASVVGTLTCGSTTSLLLGTAGSAVGNIGFRNATSGTITLAPPTGALGTVTLTLPAATDTLVALAATQTLTNKRITKRVVTAADATSITPNTDNADITYQANTQGAGTLTINADTGTPTNGQGWVLKISATAVQTFSWNAVYVGGAVALPTSSPIGISYFSFLYDTVNSKWDFVGQAIDF